MFLYPGIYTSTLVMNAYLTPLVLNGIQESEGKQFRAARRQSPSSAAEEPRGDGPVAVRK